MVPAADGHKTPTATAVVALAEVEPHVWVPYQFCVGGAAHLAGGVAHNVLPQQALDVFGNVLFPYDQPVIPSNAACGPELGHEELEDVLPTPLHYGAYLLEVDPQCLLGPDPHELRLLHCAVLLLNEVGNPHVENPYDAVEHILVGVVCLAVMHVNLLAMRGVKRTWQRDTANKQDLEFMRLFCNNCWKELFLALSVVERFLSIGSISTCLYEIAGKVSILVIGNMR